MQVSLGFMGLGKCVDETLITSLFIITVPSHQSCLCGIGFNAHEISHGTPLRLALCSKYNWYCYLIFVVSPPTLHLALFTTSMYV
jgi:hypothetical protein